MNIDFSRKIVRYNLNLSLFSPRAVLSISLRSIIFRIALIVCCGQIATSGALAADSETAMSPGLAPSFLANPVKANPLGDCSIENIRQAAFSYRYDNGDKIKMCRMLDRLRAKLWQTRGRVAELDYEVGEIWKVAPLLYFEKLGWAEKFFLGTYGHANYQQIFYPETGMVKRGTITLSLSEGAFAYTFLHELRHIKDLHDQYNARTVFSMRQIEERGFLIESYYTEATGERIAFWKEFWRDDWQKISRFERRERALVSINGYMRKYYKDLFKTPEKNTTIARNAGFGSKPN